MVDAQRVKKESSKFEQVNMIMQAKRSTAQMLQNSGGAWSHVEEESELWLRHAMLGGINRQ